MERPEIVAAHDGGLGGSRACSRASSACTKQKALSVGLSASIRASTASTTSTGETARERIFAASSVAGR